ncbi:MAG: hypothetical protein ACREDF_11980, partial [Thermoplasmata archaeon]
MLQRFHDAFPRLLVPLLVSAYFLLSHLLRADTPSNVRLLVLKNRTFSANPADPLFLPIASNTITAAGFTRIADYPARALYVGPATSAAATIPALKAEGYDAVLVPELDRIEFHEFAIDADTGISNPPVSVIDPHPQGDRGLYFLALQGYAVRAWLDDLTARNVRFVEHLPPAGYLVRGERATMDSLKSSTTYVRGVFPLAPSFKKADFEQAPVPPSPFRAVVINAVEEGPQDSIRAYLDSISDKPVVATLRSNGRISYEASLTDLDIDNVTTFE